MENNEDRLTDCSSNTSYQDILKSCGRIERVQLHYDRSGRYVDLQQTRFCLTDCRFYDKLLVTFNAELLSGLWDPAKSSSPAQKTLNMSAHEQLTTTLSYPRTYAFTLFLSLTPIYIREQAVDEYDRAEIDGRPMYSSYIHITTSRYTASDPAWAPQGHSLFGPSKLNTEMYSHTRNQLFTHAHTPTQKVPERRCFRRQCKRCRPQG